MKKTLIKEYLQFTKKEQLGLVALLTIILVFTILPFINFRQATIEKDPVIENAVAELKNKTPKEDDVADNSYDRDDHNSRPFAAAQPKGRLFNFDPNTIDESGWKELGLRERTIRTILNYRSKGGHFRKPDDLQKIYGLRTDEFERLKPYVVISGQQVSNQSRTFQKPDAPSYPPRKAVSSIDINTADTSAYIALPGIGSKLAARIVNFRNKLGGFYSIEQVGETYGVPPETFERIKPFLQTGAGGIKKLNINAATYEELNAHPYISGKLAYLIIKQRKTAPIRSAEALEELIAQTNDSFDKVAPYISF
ncbi:MAG: helix-hairpin-helix domain-containing protein [Niabella sp.]|nr:helix-hairpin-helix domain-containing protein [Niabella sp.]